MKMSDLSNLSGMMFIYFSKQLPYTVQTGSGAHPAFYPMGTGGQFSQGVKQPGHEADNSSPSSAEIKNVGAIPPLPHMSSWNSA
jgi:hypothetical protein